MEYTNLNNLIEKLNYNNLEKRTFKLLWSKFDWMYIEKLNNGLNWRRFVQLENTLHCSDGTYSLVVNIFCIRKVRRKFV